MTRRDRIASLEVRLAELQAANRSREAQVRNGLDRSLSRPADRALFGLPATERTNG